MYRNLYRTVVASSVQESTPIDIGSYGILGISNKYGLSLNLWVGDVQTTPFKVNAVHLAATVLQEPAMQNLEM